MEISEQLQCLFSGQVEKRDGSYLIEVPAQELELGDLSEGGTYRVAVFPSVTGDESETESLSESESESEPRSERNHRRNAGGPPVSVGETRTVEIEDLGEQGDGLTRVERGYVIIVPDTETGERVEIEITDVRENVGFAEVTERISYYD